RRRHTWWPRDWSSDVCSSDLDVVIALARQKFAKPRLQRLGTLECLGFLARLGREMDAPAVGRPFPVKQVRPFVGIGDVVALGIRSEERRVGKENVRGVVRCRL